MTNRTQATLFPAKEADSNTLTIFCSGCGEHGYKLDQATLSVSGILVLKCLSCGGGTCIEMNEGGAIIIVPGYPQDYFPKKKPRKRSKDGADVSAT